MPRRVAHRVLRRIMDDDAYSHITLDAELRQSDLSARDRRLATALVYGTLAWMRSIDGVLGQLVKRGIRSLDPDALWILRVGVFQLLVMRNIPDHAAVDQSVRLARKLKAHRATGLINGVLRNVIRQRDRWSFGVVPDGAPETARTLGRFFSLPDWLAQRLVDRTESWEEAVELARTLNEPSPLFARAPRGEEAPVDGEPVEGAPGALLLDGWSDAVRDALASHDVVIQDLGSQLIAHLTGASEGDRALDACAGLGGKSLLLAERVGASGSVVAVEPVARKLSLLREAATGLDVADRLQTARGTLQEFAAQEQEPFDVVLVDAPCSGLGVIRRHPETRWRRTEEDIASLASLQHELLGAAAALVRPGGVLVYSVCTFTLEEGPEQVARFLDEHPEYQLTPPEVDPDGVQWQYWSDDGTMSLWPHRHGSDGFFAARLRRTS